MCNLTGDESLPETILDDLRYNDIYIETLSGVERLLSEDGKMQPKEDKRQPEEILVIAGSLDTTTLGLLKCLEDSGMPLTIVTVNLESYLTAQRYIHSAVVSLNRTKECNGRESCFRGSYVIELGQLSSHRKMEWGLARSSKRQTNVIKAASNKRGKVTPQEDEAKSSDELLTSASDTNGIPKTGAADYLEEVQELSGAGKWRREPTKAIAGKAKSNKEVCKVNSGVKVNKELGKFRSKESLGNEDRVDIDKLKKGLAGTGKSSAQELNDILKRTNAKHSEKVRAVEVAAEKRRQESLAQGDAGVFSKVKSLMFRGTAHNKVAFRNEMSVCKDDLISLDGIELDDSDFNEFQDVGEALKREVESISMAINRNINITTDPITILANRFMLDDEVLRNLRTKQEFYKINKRVDYRLEDLLVMEKVLSEKDVIEALQEVYSIEFLGLDRLMSMPLITDLYPRDVCLKYKFMQVSKEPNVLVGTYNSELAQNLGSNFRGAQMRYALASSILRRIATEEAWGV